MRVRCLPVWLVAFLVLATGCAATQVAGGAITLNVFTAASLTEAFTELGRRFESQHPGVSVAFNFAGSQQLAQQLAQGAPADVFASANEQQMAAAIASGRIASDAPQIFARNRLLVIYPRDNPAGLTSLQDLAGVALRGRLVLAAKEVPVGQYTLAFLDRADADAQFGSDFKEAVLNNVGSYEENVRAVLAKVVLGEAYAGIVYASDVSGDDADNVGRIDIPDAFNTIARYPLAMVNDSAHPDLAAAFVQLVQSPEGQAVLAEYGLLPAGE